MEAMIAEAWYCIERYDQLQSEIEPMSAYEVLVESLSDPAIKSKDDRNNAKEKQSDNFITKFFKTILTLITNLMQAITNFVQLTFMKPEERARYEQMKKLRENDPKLKGKTLTVYDFRKIEKEYDDAERRIKEHMQKAKQGIYDGIDETISSVKDLISRNLKGLVATVAPSIAMKMASSNLEIAQKIRSSLANDKQLLSELEEQIGRRQTKKFMKGLEHAANQDRSYISRLYMSLYELRHGKADTLQDCFNQTYNEFQTLMGWKGGPLSRAITAVKNSDMIGRAMSNDALRTTAKNAAKGYLKGRSDAKKEERLIAKQQKLGGSERQTSSGRYSSVHDWATGTKSK